MSANIKQYLPAFRVSQILADQMQICKYPVNMFGILNRIPQILVSSFSDYRTWAECSGLNTTDRLKDAKCYYQPKSDIYIIVYNEKQPKKRINFSLAHELGHIVLKHLNDDRTEIERGGLDDFTYFAMEGAANTFAGNFLAPPILIHEFISGGVFDVDSIARLFNLSKQSVQGYRKQDYQYWLGMPHTQYEENILCRCKQQYYTFFCSQCDYYFSIEFAKYCPICGKRVVHIEREEKEIMGRNFPSIGLKQSGRVKECPICENAEIAEDSVFCIICGKPTVNYCSNAIADNSFGCNHVEPLTGNARYCPYCGSITTFFQYGVLPEWTEEPKDDDSDLPF